MRPKFLTRPVKLNLSMDRETKRKLFRIASDAGVSISQLVTRFVEQSEKAQTPTAK
jgi:hypothetical protein